LGVGFEYATSPATVRNEPPAAPGRPERAREIHCGSNRRSAERPPMKLEEGSKPSGGRVNADRSRWNSDVKLTDPRSPRS
jgi:hypothetical protein